CGSRLGCSRMRCRTWRLRRSRPSLRPSCDCRLWQCHCLRRSGPGSIVSSRWSCATCPSWHWHDLFWRRAWRGSGGVGGGGVGARAAAATGGALVAVAGGVGCGLAVVVGLAAVAAVGLLAVVAVGLPAVAALGLAAVRAAGLAPLVADGLAAGVAVVL